MQAADLAFHTVGAFAVAFVDHEDVGDLHDAGFDALHVVAHAGDEDDDGDIGDAHDVDFILADANGLDHNQVAAGGVEHGGNVGGGARQSAQGAARGHAANVDAGVGEVVLHADAVAEDGAAGVRAGGIDGDDADGLILLAIVLGQLVDQRALASAGRAGESEDAGVAGLRKRGFEQIGPAGGAVLDGGDGAGEGERIAGAKAVEPGLEVRGSKSQCKAEAQRGKS